MWVVVTLTPFQSRFTKSFQFICANRVSDERGLSFVNSPIKIKIKIERKRERRRLHKFDNDSFSNERGCVRLIPREYLVEALKLLHTSLKRTSVQSFFSSNVQFSRCVYRCVANRIKCLCIEIGSMHARRWCNPLYRRMETACAEESSSWQTWKARNENGANRGFDKRATAICKKIWTTIPFPCAIHGAMRTPFAEIGTAELRPQPCPQ